MKEGKKREKMQGEPDGTRKQEREGKNKEVKTRQKVKKITRYLNKKSYIILINNG